VVGERVCFVLFTDRLRGYGMVQDVFDALFDGSRWAGAERVCETCCWGKGELKKCGEEDEGEE
jgi:hypothetical protein